MNDAMTSGARRYKTLFVECFEIGSKLRAARLDRGAQRLRVGSRIPTQQSDFRLIGPGIYPGLGLTIEYFPPDGRGAAALGLQMKRTEAASAQG